MTRGLGRMKSAAKRKNPRTNKHKPYVVTQIESIINEADILIKFKETRQWFPAKQLIIDELICGIKCVECKVKCNVKDQFSFQTDAIQKFGSKIFINMIALGRILRYIGVNIMLINMEGLLPPKLVDKNVSAIKYGFSFRDAV